MVDKSNKLLSLARKSKKRVLEAVKLIKPHKKHDKFTLNYLKNYVESETFKKISSSVKLGKTQVSIQRKGYSFLISGRDLLPVVKTEDLPEEVINRFIERLSTPLKYFSIKHSNKLR